jgi:hypothetical protein
MTDHRAFRSARIWSNQQLRKFAAEFEGNVVNVSAGDDVDKEGSSYRDYFVNAETYMITNYDPGAFRGFQARENELLLDLREPVSDELRNSFDVVFNHTTLEHVFDVTTAFANICSLSKDIVILVVPFCQAQHENESYLDFWRITPTGLRRLFEINDFKVLYEAANSGFNEAVYLFVIASRQPQRWQGRFGDYEPVMNAADWVGKTASLASIVNESMLLLRHTLSSLKKSIKRGFRIR